MTGGDARGEAERIVDGFVQAICDLFDGSALLPEAEENDRERLVAALAAAIEETDAEQDDRWGFYSDMPEAEQRLHEAEVARREALSALRARAGEDGDD